MKYTHEYTSYKAGFVEYQHTIGKIKHGRGLRDESSREAGVTGRGQA